MRRSAMIPGNPWTLFITLEEEPDSLGCRVVVVEMTMDGNTSDSWELHYNRVEEALREMEMAYGIAPDEWLELG